MKTCSKIILASGARSALGCQLSFPGLCGFVHVKVLQGPVKYHFKHVLG